MSRSTEVKTDNSHLGEKIRLRVESVNESAPGIIRVLDAFSGQGTLWDSVRKLTGRDIVSTRIDQKPDRRGAYLRGDNTKWLYSLDLSRFDIIDLDAYGIPYSQLEALRVGKFSGEVHITYIQTMFGALPRGILSMSGLAFDGVDMNNCVFWKVGTSPLFAMLSEMGATSVRGYFFDKKTYLRCKVNCI